MMPQGSQVLIRFVSKSAAPVLSIILIDLLKHCPNFKQFSWILMHVLHNLLVWSSSATRLYRGEDNLLICVVVPLQQIDCIADRIVC